MISRGWAAQRAPIWMKLLQTLSSHTGLQREKKRQQQEWNQCRNVPLVKEETALNKKEDAGDISSSWNSLSTKLLSFFKGIPLTENLQNYFSEVLIALRSSLVSQSAQSLHLWLFQHIFLFFTKSFFAVAEATALQRPTSTSSFLQVLPCLVLHVAPEFRTKLQKQNHFIL